MEAGDVVFSKKVSELYVDKKTGEIAREEEYGSTVRGSRYISMLLGVLRPKKSPPTTEEITLLLASVGYIGTNDITECLGEKATKKILDFIKKTYDVKPGRQ